MSVPEIQFFPKIALTPSIESDMVRANGREEVVPANRDPMDTLSVGADTAPMGADCGGLSLVFRVRLLHRSNVRGSAALCRRAADRALRRAERFVVDHRAVAAADAVSSRTDCAAVFP